MSDILSFLNAHQGAVTAAATVSIAIFSCFTAFLSYQLVSENRKMRRIGMEPNVIASLSLDDDTFWIVNLALINVGRGSAKNITYFTDLDEKYIGSMNGVIPINDEERTPISFLFQDDRIIVGLGTSHDLIEMKVPPINIYVKWENLAGKKFKDKYTLDVLQFSGMQKFNTSKEEEIAKSLKKIADRLDSFARAGSMGRLKVETMTAKEAQEEQRRLRGRDR